MSSKKNSADIFAAIQSAAESQAEAKNVKKPEAARSKDTKKAAPPTASSKKTTPAKEPALEVKEKTKEEIKETVQEPAEPVKKVTSGITIPMGKSKTTRAVAKTFYLDADSHEKLLGWMEKYNQSASRIINELIRQVDL